MVSRSAPYAVLAMASMLEIAVGEFNYDVDTGSCEERKERAAKRCDRVVMTPFRTTNKL